MKSKLLAAAVAVCISSCLFSARAAVVNDSINALFQQIVVSDPNSVPVTFINDDTHPWTYSSSAIKSPTLNKNEISTLSFTFTSERKTEVQFTWQASVNGSSTTHDSEYLLDGELVASKKSGTETRRFILDAGTHTLSFQDSVWGSSSNYWTKISALRVRESAPLELTVLAEGSMPLTFDNNGDWPWTSEDGYIQNGNYGNQNTISRFSTTFTINKPSLFEFEAQVTNYSTTSTANHKLQVWESNNDYSESWNYQSWKRTTYVLEPGTYTFIFQDTIYSTNTYYSRIRNISLTDAWPEVELAYSGTLGSEVLGLFETLTDVELLKVKGTLNSTDWNTIAKMTNLKGLDLSKATFTEVPEKGFNALTLLSYLTLPEGLTTIGSYAFQNTQIVRFHLPSSVTTLGARAFYEEKKLTEVLCSPNAQLATIGTYAFYNCTRLKHFIMPNTVTTVGTYTFAGCSAMDTIILSDILTTLPDNMCRGCKSFAYIHLPSNVNTISASCFYNGASTQNTTLRSISFPESLRTIGESAFSNYSNLDSIILPAKLSSLGANAFEGCTGTTYIQLPSYISGYDYNFMTCSSLRKVVCPSVTPPTITNDPFSGGRSKTNITLEVPSFAMNSYKLHTYWYKFGNIVAGEDVDYWRVSGDLVLNDSARTSRAPYVSITTSGKMTITGSEPLHMSRLDFNCSSSSSSALLNACPALSSDSILSYYYINEAEKWYFITPLYDMNLSAASHQGGNSFVIRYYDGERRATNGSGGWQNVSDTELHRGQGYILRSNGTGWMTLRDDMHQGAQMFDYNDYTMPLQAHASTKTANENWNFIGNPYPCYYDIWYMDFYTPITVWTGSTYKAYSIQDDSYALRPMQAFFVQKPATLDNIVFHKEGRQTTSSIGTHSTSPAPARTAANAQRQIINLSIMADDEVADETRVVINPAASLEYEMRCDASKFMSFETEVPQIYSLGEDGVRMSINERPLSDGMIPLGCYIGTPGCYSIAAPAEDNVTLIDNLTGTTHDFLNGSYTFSASESGDIIGRFFLNVAPRHEVPTAIQDNTAELDVRAFAGGLAIDCSAFDATVYTIDGRMIAHCAAGQGWARLFLPQGIYVIKAGGQTVKQVVE